MVYAVLKLRVFVEHYKICTTYRGKCLMLDNVMFYIRTYTIRVQIMNYYYGCTTYNITATSFHPMALYNDAILPLK